MSFEDYYNQFNDNVNPMLQPLDDYYYVKLTLAITLMLYGGLAAPTFPTKYLWLFSNVWFKVLLLSVISYTMVATPVLGIACAVLFLFLLDNYIKNPNVTENYEGNQSGVYPGCLNLTAQDLLDSFNGDKNALFAAMMNSKIPLDVELSDESSPQIGTYLINRGFAVKAPCAFADASSNMAMS